MEGHLDLAIDFVAQNGSGTNKSVSRLGDDADDHIYSLFEPLNIVVTDINATNFVGSVAGSLPQNITLTTVVGIDVGGGG